VLVASLTGLGSFICGIALGELRIRRRIDRLHSPVRFLAHVRIALGRPGGRHPTDLPEAVLLDGGPAVQPAPTEVGQAIFSFLSHGMALSVMLSATFCAGMTLPLVTVILVQQGGGERSNRGERAYSIWWPRS
jgi:hypothetical protein